MLDLFNLDYLLLCLIWLMLIGVCYYDIKYRIIPNKLIIIFFCLILIRFLCTDGNLNYLAAGGFLIIGIVLFYLKLVGAGDIKLISVLLLSLSAAESWEFIIVMIFCGLPLALIFIVIRLITKKRYSLPYGVAIAAGYFLVSLHHLSL